MERQPISPRTELQVSSLDSIFDRRKSHTLNDAGPHSGNH